MLIVLPNKPERFFPAPPPTHPTIHLSAGNVLTAWSKELSDTPLLYLDESTMQWCVLDMHISEVACARKAD